MFLFLCGFSIEHRDHNEDEIPIDVCMLAISITIFSVFIAHFCIFWMMEPAFIRATFFLQFSFQSNVGLLTIPLCIHTVRDLVVSFLIVFFFCTQNYTFVRCLLIWPSLHLERSREKKKHTQFSNSLHKHQQTQRRIRLQTHTQCICSFTQLYVWNSPSILALEKKRKYYFRLSKRNTNMKLFTRRSTHSVLLVCSAGASNSLDSKFKLFKANRDNTEVRESIGWTNYKLSAPSSRIRMDGILVEVIYSVAHIVEFEFAGLCELC